MDRDTHSLDLVQVEVTLTIDGDWNSDPLKLLSGLGEGRRCLELWQRPRHQAPSGPSETARERDPAADGAT
jgi:hypothetical protein